jgi:multiple sugar transport system permease protein
VLMTRAFPLPLLALPLAVMFIRTGLDDTVLGLALVHTTLALPFAVLITFSLFSGIPLELEEAAWTLGCTRLQAFRKVIMPLALPGHRRSLPSRSHGTRYSRPRCSPSRTGR